MRRAWLPLVLVVVVGALVGLAIAGRPAPSDSFSVDPAAVAALTSTTVEASTTSDAATTTTTESLPSTTADVSPSSTAAPSTSSSTSSTSSTSTSLDQATTTTTPAIDRRTLRVVIANADGRTGLAQANADRLSALGYETIDLGDSPQNLASSVIYYRTGFLDEAAVVAADLAIPDIAILEYPSDLAEPLTNSDDAGDVIVLLGADAPR